MTNPTNPVSETEDPGTPGELSQLITFVLCGQTYCVDIMSVCEIRMLQSITHVPGARDHVRGVINLRGSIVPVYDLRKRFGLGETQLMPSHPSVIVNVGARMCALLVDEVLDIVTIASTQMGAIPTGKGENPNPFFRGVISHDTGMLIAVDLETLFAGEQITEAASPL